MKLNLKNGVTANINECHTVFVREGYGEDYYFVRYCGVVYFCGRQEDELYIIHRVCDEAHCDIKFPCYGID